MKQCVGCTFTKSFSEFYPAKNQVDGYNRYCKDCCKVNRALEAVRKRDKKNNLTRRQIQRAQQLGIECHTDFDLGDVFKRHRGICHICQLWVQPRHASPDHIVPLSKGGTHTFTNVGLSHLKCNLRKGNRA